MSRENPHEHRILVVDDDDELAGALSDILQARGYHVRQARNGREALGSIEELRPCLIILDLMMPIMNGWEFLEEFASMPSEQRPTVLVLTAFDGTDLPRGCLTLFKPPSLNSIVDVVHLHCGRDAVAMH